MTHVVAAIIVKPGEAPAYLLVSSKKDFGDFSGYYYPPAGHIEDGEEELVALKRELVEELGIKILRAEKITDTKGDVKDQTTSWYLCNVDSYDFTINNQELRDAGFFTEQEMMQMNIWPATQNVFDRFIFDTK